MRVQLACLCDYGADHFGKLVLVGIGNTFPAPPSTPEGAPIQLARHQVVVRLGASTSEDGTHFGVLRLVNADGEEIGKSLPCEIVIPRTSVPGQEMVHTWFSVFDATHVPGVGSYVWEVWVDAQRLGEVPFHVTAMQPTTDMVLRQ